MRGVGAGVDKFFFLEPEPINFCFRSRSRLKFNRLQNTGGGEGGLGRACCIVLLLFVKMKSKLKDEIKSE